MFTLSPEAAEVNPDFDVSRDSDEVLDEVYKRLLRSPRRDLMYKDERRAFDENAVASWVPPDEQVDADLLASLLSPLGIDLGGQWIKFDRSLLQILVDLSPLACVVWMTLLLSAPSFRSREVKESSLAQQCGAERKAIAKILQILKQKNLLSLKLRKGKAQHYVISMHSVNDNRKQGAFIRIHTQWLKSALWKQSHTSIKLGLVYMLYASFNPTKLEPVGTIKQTLSSLCRVSGMSKPTVLAANKQLESIGFVKEVKSYKRGEGNTVRVLPWMRLVYIHDKGSLRPDAI